MNDTHSPTRRASLPAGLVPALSGALAEHLDPAQAAEVLRGTGFALGGSLAELLEQRGAENSPGADLQEVPEERFWALVGELWEENGWGRLGFQPLHPGVGALELENGFEADPDAGAAHPSCHLTTGMLAELLRGAAGEPVAVLEAECRSRGDGRCRFLFGSERTLGEVYRAVQEGASPDRAVQALG